MRELIIEAAATELIGGSLSQCPLPLLFLLVFFYLPLH
jgi:hypothetical protein